ncbi:MAG: hypothetical protein ABH803_00065 [Candidatus Micrarchaeota archaeon]
MKRRAFFYSVSLLLLFSLLFALALVSSENQIDSARKIDSNQVLTHYANIESNFQEVFSKLSVNATSFNNSLLVFDRFPAKTPEADLLALKAFEENFSFISTSIDLSDALVPRLSFGNGSYYRSGGDIVFDTQNLSSLLVVVVPSVPVDLYTQSYSFVPPGTPDSLTLFLLINSSVPFLFSGVINKSEFNFFIFNSSSLFYNASFYSLLAKQSSDFNASVFFYVSDSSGVELINALRVFSIVASKNGSIKVTRNGFE